MEQLRMYSEPVLGDGHYAFGNLGVIAMKGCEKTGEEINRHLHEFRYGPELGTLNLENFLIKTSCPRFTTGEAKAIIGQSVRGYDIFILCDCYNYSVKYKMYDMDTYMSPDDHYRDLVRTIAALNGKARRINVIMPMLYSSRQDNRTSRESLDCAISLQELAKMGVSNILCFDAHEPRVQNAIPLSGFDTITPSYQMIKALCKNVKDIELTSDKALIIAPDEGAMSRCLRYSAYLGLGIGMFYKRRDYERIEDGEYPVISHDFLGSRKDVEGKDVIIIDDILATGGSLIQVAKKLNEMGAKRIFTFITFGQFSKGTKLFDEAYDRGIIDKIFVTNANYKDEKITGKPWYCDVDISKYLAKLINALNCDHSISELLNPIEKINGLKESKNKITMI